MTETHTSNSELILYQTEDSRTRIQRSLEGETIWLTQSLMAELFQKDVRTIYEHLVNIFDEGELTREATIRKFRIVRNEGKRQVSHPFQDGTTAPTSANDCYKYHRETQNSTSFPIPDKMGLRTGSDD